MAPRSKAKAKPPPWLELPEEITRTILFKLPTIDTLTVAQKVCRLWCRLIRDSSPSMWKKIDMENLGNLYEMPYDLVEMCRDAVNRSQGQLIDINIEHFRTDDLILYISHRCRQLKRLSIAMSGCIAEVTVREAFQNFALLEELHLMFTTIDDENIRVIGRLCPRLKSFRMNDEWYKYPAEDCDQQAVAIAESMPELCHLDLIGNKVTNVCLKAILDGCHHLESLDLRLCFNVDLGRELGALCSQRVKNLKGPHDSLSGCKFNYRNPDVEYSVDEYTEMSPYIDMGSDDDDDLEFSGNYNDDEDDGDSNDEDNDDSDEENSGDSDEENSGDSGGYNPFYDPFHYGID